MEIVSYQPEYEVDFLRLMDKNLPPAVETMKFAGKQNANPGSRIVEQGGAVCFARVEGSVVGCCALIAHDDNRFELAKMVVDPEFRRLGLGRLLGLRVIHLAQELGAGELFLDTRREWVAAIKLYESLGFKRSDTCESAPGCDLRMYY